MNQLKQIFNKYIIIPSTIIGTLLMSNCNSTTQQIYEENNEPTTITKQNSEFNYFFRDINEDGKIDIISRNIDNKNSPYGIQLIISYDSTQIGNNFKTYTTDFIKNKGTKIMTTEDVNITTSISKMQQQINKNLEKLLN